MTKPLQIIKTNEQIERKYRKVYKKMNELNDPKRYEGRDLTQEERIALEKAFAEWQMMAWLTGKYSI